MKYSSNFSDSSRELEEKKLHVLFDTDDENNISDSTRKKTNVNTAPSGFHGKTE